MQYETAVQMAERLGVTVRVVQIWAKGDRLPGAIKQGRDWLIPAGLQRPDRKGYTQAIEREPLPLISNDYKQGFCLEYIELLNDETLKSLAMAEYYYFTGKAKLAADTTEIFFNHHDVIIKLSACLIYSFSNLALGNIHLAEMGFDCIKDSIRAEMDKDATPQFKAACVLVATTAAVLLHEEPPEERLVEYIKFLPRGLQLWAFYILSHQEYLNKEHNKALGIVETALALTAIDFPVATLYLHLSAAMNLMAMKRVDEAKSHFAAAWDIALKDNFIQPFAEHHGLLYGLLETCLKTQYPKEYKAITSLTYNFAKGWRRVHNSRMKKEVTSSLTTTEFAIAMLADRGWTNLEISEYMNFSLHTVKRYISIIYQKLAISSRGELKRFIH